MTDEKTMNEIEPTVIELDQDDPVEGTGNEVSFHVAGTFAEFDGGDDDVGAMPLLTAIRTGLNNGYPTFETDLVPMMEGSLDHGSFHANVSIAGLHLIEYDRGPNGHNLLARARPPKGKAINATTVGQAMVRLLEKRVTRQRNSMVAIGPRSRSE